MPRTLLRFLVLSPDIVINTHSFKNVCTVLTHHIKRPRVLPALFSYLNVRHLYSTIITMFIYILSTESELANNTISVFASCNTGPATQLGIHLMGFKTYVPE